MPTTQVGRELGSPDHWRIKGEGNANWVFAYTGDLPHLAGKVLRVRKPKKQPNTAQLALEEAVWAPVLGSGAALPPAVEGSSPAAAREERYVERLMTPLLGSRHIPPQQPVQPRLTFLQQVLALNRCIPAPAGASNSGDAVAPGTAALLPDVTLLPGSMGHADSTAKDAAAGAPAAAPAQQAATAQQPQQAQHAWRAEGPVVCVELKPKCGFVSSCGTVHPDNHALKRSRSRYQLHQMLKLAQGKVAACSSYDPCDLFSGHAARLRQALAALLHLPQNNLLLFVDGVKQRLAQQQAQLVQNPLQQQQQQHQEQQPTSQEQQVDKAAAPCIDDVLAGLLPLPTSERQAALVELVAAALEREGVLQRLLQAQQQCPYDIEGIYQLYCKLAAVHAVQASQAVPPAPAGGDASLGDAEPQPQLQMGTGTSCDSAASGSSAAVRSSGGGGGGGGSTGADDAGSHLAAVQQLLALPIDEAYAVLRAYVVAATAKDCAIMIALQRLIPATAAAASSGSSSSTGLPVQHQGASRLQQLEQPGGGAADAQAMGVQEEQGKQLPAGCLQYQDSSGTAWYYQYRLYFVDLDMKPLAKIPQHHALDQQILAAARLHLSASGSDVPP